MTRTLLRLALALALAAAPAAAHIAIVPAPNIPTCDAGKNFAVFVTLGDITAPCTTSTTSDGPTLLCLCKDSEYSSVAYGSGVPGGQYISGDDTNGTGSLQLRANNNPASGQATYFTLTGDGGITLGATDTDEPAVYFIGPTNTAAQVVTNAGSVQARTTLCVDPALSGTNRACLAYNSATDKLCHDTDSDGACDAGEGNLAGGWVPSAASLPTCNATLADGGVALYWDTTGPDLCVCNGTSWAPVDGAGTCS
ncbi:MAG: hypothetical protein F9K18_01115 [Thermoanaerobaculia bacterium]|nr:MAG: hypothetical protein F9K18_01115 [Thermoanaerobaculia bacterium]